MEQNELEKKITDAQKAYYDGNSEMSDSEFDFLWDELKSKYPNSKLLSNVGSDSVKGKKIKHKMLMGSQEKFNTHDGLLNWLEKENIQWPIIVEPKYDGISCELQYENGALTCLTRGDGYFGEDITRAVEKMRGVPRILKKNISFSVRGEILIAKSIFERKYQNEFKNPRNFVAGAVKNENFIGYEDFSVISYDVYSDGHVFSTERKKLAFLEENGFIPAVNYLCNSVEEIEEFRSYVKGKIDYGAFEYGLDGLVLKQDICNENDLNELRPKKQHAYKWKDDGEVTTILDIEWNLNGETMTPVAILEPVEIEGTTVSRASLANPDLIAEMGLKRYDEVYITKRGMIIPKIESVISHTEKSVDFEIPEICPVCGSKLVNSGSKLYCPNKDCRAKINHRITKWVNALEAKGFGKTLIDFCVENGVSKISDLYCFEIKNHICDTFGSINAEKAFTDLYEKSEGITLAQFISGYDINGIGIEMTQGLISAGYDTLYKLENLTLEDICNVSGWQTSRANDFLRGFNELKEDMFFLYEHDCISFKKEVKIIGSCILQGKKCCVTGKLNEFSRKQIEAYMKERGIISVGAVTKDTDYLVTNDTTSGSSKNVAAKKFGTKIISEKEFIEMSKNF